MGLIVRFTVGFGDGFTVGFGVGCTTGLGATGAIVEPGIFFVASMITFPVMGSVCTSIQTLFVHCAAMVEVASRAPTKTAIGRTIENKKVLIENTHAGYVTREGG